MVNKTQSCWLWCGYTVNKYGMFYPAPRINGKQHHVRAHRFAYEEANGPIPEGLHVLHRCDVPLCVRPDHLFLGTNVENSADRNQKGRQARGERQGSAKLTVAIVRRIRKAFAEDGITTTELAARHGVARSTIRAIVSRKNWKHVE